MITVNRIKSNFPTQANAVGSPVLGQSGRWKYLSLAAVLSKAIAVSALETVQEQPTTRYSWGTVATVAIACIIAAVTCKCLFSRKPKEASVQTEVSFHSAAPAVAAIARPKAADTVKLIGLRGYFFNASKVPQVNLDYYFFWSRACEPRCVLDVRSESERQANRNLFPEKGSPRRFKQPCVLEVCNVEVQDKLDIPDKSTFDEFAYEVRSDRGLQSEVHRVIPNGELKTAVAVLEEFRRSSMAPVILGLQKAAQVMLAFYFKMKFDEGELTRDDLKDKTINQLFDALQGQWPENQLVLDKAQKRQLQEYGASLMRMQEATPPLEEATPPSSGEQMGVIVTVG